MMVIRAQNAASGGIPVASGSTFNIFPADRCTWRQQDSTNGGYEITFARFLSNEASALTLTAPTLGYIGKSGRFVAISN